jgi:arylsulfatase A-like enzyme
MKATRMLPGKKFLGELAVLTTFFGAASACWAAGPNVMVIVADDFGYGDLSVHGCKDIPTPHLDSLAKNGVRCSNGYVSAPQCSPTRAGLMTGRYQQRFGHEHNQAFSDSALALNEVPLPERMKAAGYVTGMVGKWHLGSDESHHPLNRGFQEFFGFLGGANPYLPKGPTGVVPRILRGREDANEKEYLTDAFGREAVAFIDRHQKEPFFLYLAFNAPHGPLEASPKYLERFATIENETRRTYAAMVSAMDDAVGAVLDKLRSARLEENTLIFFISDNGGPTEVNASQNTPFRGVKGEVREGGIRSPFFIQWKGRLPAGKVYERPVIQLDIFPTALAAAGGSTDAKFDGVDLLPYLTGEKTGDPHETLYWRFNFPPNQPARHKWAIRQGEWKLFTDIAGRRSPAESRESLERPILVNLANDPAESKDLSEQHPEKVQALEAAWRTWNAKMAEPGQPKKVD